MQKSVTKFKLRKTKSPVICTTFFFLFSFGSFFFCLFAFVVGLVRFQVITSAVKSKTKQNKTKSNNVRCTQRKKDANKTNVAWFISFISGILISSSIVVLLNTSNAINSHKIELKTKIRSFFFFFSFFCFCLAISWIHWFTYFQLFVFWWLFIVAVRFCFLLGARPITLQTARQMIETALSLYNFI